MVKAIKLILSDIDGTILDDKHQLDSDLGEAVATLKARKIPFVLASARSPHGMFPLAEKLNLGSNPIACYNGALIVEGNRENFTTLIEHTLDKKEVKKVIDVIHSQFPHIAVNVYSNGDWIVEKRDKWVQIESDITKETPLLNRLDELLADSKRPIHKLLLIAEADEIQELLVHLKTLSFADASFYLSKANYLEVISKSVSKENALMEIASYYDVPLAATMTIGDNFNDLPMLKLAGLGVAMGNAPQAVKDGADQETASNNDKGASKAIKKYVLH
ncbi:Cof-type HAD-IIB family hydrolase [Streptococcus orisasini]